MYVRPSQTSQTMVQHHQQLGKHTHSIDVVHAEIPPEQNSNNKHIKQLNKIDG